MHEERAAHARFLDRYYGASRGFYDVSRRYYLLGRDEVLVSLANERWSALVDVGCGTGRNLEALRRLRPDAAYGGVDASTAMLDVARARCPWAALHHGFAEDAPLDALVGPPDRVLFSYSLSMIQDPRGAIAHAASSVAPDGEVVVVDFGPLSGVPAVARGAFAAWLRSFHVTPVAPAALEAWGGRVRASPRGYWLTARFSRAAS